MRYFYTFNQTKFYVMRRFPVMMGLLCACLFAQSQTPQQLTFKRCATYESMQEFRRLNPGAETDEQFEAWLAQKTLERRTTSRENAAFVIPIIFHIVHNGEAIGTGSNLAASKIQSQLAQLNEDYANLSGSLYGVAANMEIQFCLARRAPNGTELAEPGIDRVNGSTMTATWGSPPYDGDPIGSTVDAQIMPATIWDPYQYFNVWTLPLAGTLLGKATFPTGSTLMGLGSGETDTHAGVFVDYRSVGSKTNPGPFSSQAGLGRTLSHEAGHFFGLRHIWGDANCGNDFCADTPPQNAQTSGCPSSPAANGCFPSANKMFENYMDYTFDACVNTFTNDQKTRMQTVMANSPRRVTLGTSLACVPPVGNSISFTTQSTSASEAAVVTTCPSYREVTATVLVSTAASGNATVTFTKAGTATENVDYTITPASVSFTNGDATPKVVTIRIWDDAIPESPETIILGYTITGTGVVAGAAWQTHTITIIDNDLTPIIHNSGVFTMLNENFGTSGGTIPPGWLNGSFAAGANTWTIGTNGGAGITGQAAYITNNTTTRPYAYTFNGVTAPSNAVIVTPPLNGAGMTNMKLSFRYKCNGEADVDGVYDFGTLYYTTDGSNFFLLPNSLGQQYIFQGVSVATDATNLPLPAFPGAFAIGFAWENDDNIGNNPPFLIDDVVITADAVKIEEQAANAGTENIFSGQNALILSGNDRQVIARITNPSADLGCVTATVTDAGTGQVNVNTSAGTFQRTQKIIRITPAIPAPGVTYEATFYYSTAELAAWGSNRLLLKILKVQDGVDLASATLNSSNTEIITPTSVVENAASGYITYTASFTGFSQFVLASPTVVLPVNLVAFEANPVKRSIQLDWSTAQEDNNRGFHIERSTSGATYEKIGWVAGKGNTTERVDYKYIDNFVQPGVLYYYRLRQEDFDGNQKLSMIRTARIDEKGTIITLTPNPTRDNVKLFISGTTGRADLNILNTQGQVVRSWKQVNATAAPVPLDTRGLAAGLYLVHIRMEGETKVEKLVIE